jgi:hypothetical protein
LSKILLEFKIQPLSFHHIFKTSIPLPAVVSATFEHKLLHFFRLLIVVFIITDKFFTFFYNIVASFFSNFVYHNNFCHQKHNPEAFSFSSAPFFLSPTEVVPDAMKQKEFLHETD